MTTIKIDFDTKNIEEKTQKIREEFRKKNCPDFEFNLSRLNLIDASKIALAFSAELIKYNTKSKITCFVRDVETLNIILPRKLKNIYLSANLKEKKSEFSYKNVQNF